MRKPKVAEIDQSVIEAAVEAAGRRWRRELEEARRVYEARIKELSDQLETARELAARIVAMTPGAFEPPPESSIAIVTREQRLKLKSAIESKPKSTPRPAPASNGHHSLSKGELAILTVAAQYPDGATREQLTVLTGYKRSSRDTYLQRLRASGLIAQVGEAIIATPDGVAALGPEFEPLPVGEELQAYWLDRLPEGERRILEILLGRYPRAVDREALSEATDYKRSSRDTYLQRLSARRLITIVGRGEVRASEVFFE